MPDPRIASIVRRTARLPARPGTPDAALLARVARDGDPEAASELVARHGAAVWAACRRAAPTEADAEDVFQATFLVLARDAARVRKAASVGSWLFGVAHRLGREVRARHARRPDPARLARRPVPDPAADVTWAEVRAALDDELARLPDGLRAPLLLCYYDGMTQDEAAAELGWTARAVKARVARGRAVLRARLTRRGIELPAALAAPLLAAAGPAPAPAALVAAAVNVARLRPPGPGVSPAAAVLACTGGHAVSPFRTALGLACAAALATAGSVAALRDAPGAADPPSRTGGPARPAPPAAEPLPPGAVARLGTGQFRQVGWHHRAFFTPDPDVVVKAEQGLVRFWHVPTGKKVHDLTLPDAQTYDADATPDGRLVAVAGWYWADPDHFKSQPAVWLIDAAARKLLRRIDVTENERGERGKVRLSADGKRVFAAFDGDVRVWDARTGDELIRHKSREGTDAFAVSPDGKRVVFGRHDVFAWEWETGAEPKTVLRLAGAGTFAAWFAPDNRTLYVWRDGRLAVVDAVAGRQTRLLDLPAASLAGAVSPDGKTIAVAVSGPAGAGSEGAAVVLVDAATGGAGRRLPVGRGEIGHLSWSADGARLAAVDDYRVTVWDVATGRVLGPTRPGHEANIAGLAFTPDGTLVTASDDHTVRTWGGAGESGRVLRADGWVRGLAVSADGALIAGSALRDDLRVWESKTGRERFKLLGNGWHGGTRVVRFTPDGKRLVAWGDDEFLRVWDTRNGRLLAEHTTRPPGEKDDPDDPFADRRRMMGGLSNPDVSPDGTTFALPAGTTVRLIDPMTGQTRRALDLAPAEVTRVAFAPDGRRLAAAGRGRSIETKLPDGRTRFGPADDHPIAVWDVLAGKAVWAVAAPGHWPSALAFTPDGAKVAELPLGLKGGYSVRFRDAATGADAGRIDLPERGWHLAFDRPGRRLAVSFSDTTATVFDLATALVPPGGRP